MDEIFRRGTCRYFKEKMPVPDDELLTLVKAGMQARVVGNQKSRDFIIVTREDLVKAISHNSIIAGPARKASAAIVIVGKRMAFPSPRNGPLTALQRPRIFWWKQNIWDCPPCGCRFILTRTEKSTSAIFWIFPMNWIPSASLPWAMRTEHRCA